METPKADQPFWINHFAAILAAWTLVWLAIFLIQYLRFRRKGNPFPQFDPRNVLFKEKGASGNSNKSWFTMIGGASRILWVTVTQEEVWIRPRPFLLSRMFGADRFDLIHRIQKGQIVSANREAPRGRERVALEFTLPDGKTRFFFLYLSESEGFVRAVSRR